ncbi:MAG: DMT family transporter [Thiolinea sp.]
MHRQTNNKLGIILMLGGMFMFSAVDTQAKFLTGAFHPVQVIWLRQLGLLVGVLILLFLKGAAVLQTAQPLLQLSRGFLAICSALLFVFGIRYAELADAVAVSFVAPFFLTILGSLTLGERVGARRWIAVVLGFIGALVIIRPGTDAVHPAVIFVVFAAFFFALRQVIGRKLADTDNTSTTVAYTAIIGSLLISIPLPFVWQTPESGQQLLIIVSMTVMAAVGEILVIKALEVAEVVVVAPIHYTLIIWGTFYGYIVFGQLPDFWTWVGTAIIVSAGLFTFYRQTNR